MSTNAYAAKRAIIERLKADTANPGSPLKRYDATVQYAFNATKATAVTIYGGAVTFDQPEDGEVVDGERNRLVQETASIGLHIRVQRAPDPGDDDPIVSTDEICDELGDWLGDLLSREPRLAGGASISRISSGRGDYFPNEQQAVSVLSYTVDVTSHIKQPSI